MRLHRKMSGRERFLLIYGIEDIEHRLLHLLRILILRNQVHRRDTV